MIYDVFKNNVNFLKIHCIKITIVNNNLKTLSKELSRFLQSTKSKMSKMQSLRKQQALKNLLPPFYFTPSV